MEKRKEGKKNTREDLRTVEGNVLYTIYPILGRLEVISCSVRLMGGIRR